MIFEIILYRLRKREVLQPLFSKSFLLRPGSVRFGIGLAFDFTPFIAQIIQLYQRYSRKPMYHAEIYTLKDMTKNAKLESQNTGHLTSPN